MAKSKVELDIVADGSQARREISQTENALKGMKGGLNDVIEGLTGFNIGQLGVISALVAAGNEMRKDVAETLDYNKTIRDLAAVSRLTTEETSRMVQAADDYGITTDTMGRAMEMALKNGFTPSISAIADLADKYNSMSDPAERAAEMAKIFGRNWAELTPLLEAGGAAIRSTSAGVADNLVVTEAAAKASREYEIQMDNLGDAIQGIKMSIGNMLIPALTDGAKAMNHSLKVNVAMHEILSKLPEDQRQNAFYADKYTGELTKQAEAMVAASDAAEMQQRALQEGYKAIEGYVGMARISATATDGMTAAEQRAQAGAELLKGAMGELTKQLIFSTAAQGLDSDQALKLAEKMGMVDYATVNAITSIQTWRQQLAEGKITLEEYDALVLRLTGDINAMPSSKDIDINVRYNTSGNPNIVTVPGETGTGSGSNLPYSNPAQGSSPTWNPGSYGYTPQLPTSPAERAGYGLGHAEGGHMDAGEPGIVGERGPEGWIPDHSGTIVPNNQLGGTTVNIQSGAIVVHAAPTQSADQVAELVMRKISDKVRAAKYSGKGYMGGY